MIRKRFPWPRSSRIAAWTAFALAWTTTLVARTVGAPVAAAPEAPLAPAAEAAVAEVPAAATTAVPVAPVDGLVILRYTPVERPEPEVQRVVVTQQAPAPATQPPTTKRSSGS